MTHELKVWRGYFNDIESGVKNFELRWNDRDYKVGDKLILKCYDPLYEKFDGRQLERTVDYILYGNYSTEQFGIKVGACIMSWKPCTLSALLRENYEKGWKDGYDDCESNMRSEIKKYQ